MGAAESIEVARLARDARGELHALIGARGWTKTEAARRMGVSVTVVSRWLQGAVNARAAALARRLLDTERDTADASMPGLSRHADLAVTEQIAGVAAHAQANRDLVVVYGAAGSGKSWALERYCEEHAGAWLAAMSPSVTTPAGVLRRIAKALEGSAPAKTCEELERAIIDRLSAGMTLLVVDEAHHLSQALLDVVRCVYDAAGCGLTLCGNEPLWARLAAGERAAQLVSRVGIRHRLGRPANADVVALAETLMGRPVGGAARKAALGIGTGVGALRSVQKLVAQARMLARGDERDRPTDRDLVDAAELLRL